jgi:fatty acid desaturase
MEPVILIALAILIAVIALAILIMPNWVKLLAFLLAPKLRS